MALHARWPTMGDCFVSIVRWLLAAAALHAPLAQADTWPSKPIKLIVAFPAGGVGDLMARLVATPLADALGQPLVIENRSGGGGNVGSMAGARAAPDGYTLLVTATSVESINPLVFPNMGFNPSKELVPVAMLGGVKLFLVARPTLPVTDVDGLVAYGKAHAGKLSFGSASIGSMTHLAAELFRERAGFAATHVPYRGAAPALQDLLAGQIDYLLDPGIAFQYVRTGKLKMLAVASMTRSQVFPDVPTLHELGYRDISGDTLFGVYAPAGTPPALVSRLNKEINEALRSPALKARLAEVGGETMPMSPAEFAAYVKTERAMYQHLVKSLGIVAE